MRRILVATDGSDGATAAVDEALALAKETGALVTIVCVRRVPELLGSPYYQHALSDELRRGRAVIDEAAERASHAGIEAETEILTGQPAEEVVRIAAARDVDLIVVGSHGRGRVASALLGSVARAVVHSADRPVLIVKHGAHLLEQAA